jgi:3-deoxy-7-phosphoheptulonate synthase
LHDITNLGIPCATEFVDSSIIPDYIAEYISWAAIGARTVESRDHRNLASGLSMPVGFKNDRAGHIGAAVDAIITARNPRTFLGGTEYGGHAIVSTTGNDCTHIVLRGGEKEPNYDKAHVAEAQELLRKSDLPPTIIVDCSHGNSSKDHRKQPIVFKDVIKQRKEGNLSIVGVMIESHIKEGQFKIPDDLKGFDKSVIPFGISGTDACIGWDDTEDLIKNS